MKFKSHTLIFGIVLFTTLSTYGAPLDLTSKEDGVHFLKNYQGVPDSQGVMETFTLKVPPFNRAAYYRGYWWPYAGNRVRSQISQTPEGDEGGIFLLLELKDGGYLAALPLSGDQAYAWLAPDGKNYQLKFGTHGKANIQGDMPVIAWAQGRSPYEACSKVWTAATKTPQIKGHMKLREDKPYPQVFRYLGWCSWEGYHKNISSENMIAELQGLRQSPVPIRYFLVDDGHFDSKSLAPKSDTFPQGYAPLTQQRNPNNISWVGMWHALLGNASAIKPPANLGPASTAMMQTHNGLLVPKPDPASIETFLRYLLQYSKRDSIDFLKVDFYGALLPFYAGTSQKNVTANFPKDNTHAIANPHAATVTYARVFQNVADDMFDGLINCNWHQPQFLFNSANSSVGRCSADYSVGNLAKAKPHIYNSYASTLWLGQIAWGDHDMFHSHDPVAGRMMAVSKALSGAPVYLSDRHADLDPNNIMPLCYEDGLLLRPLAPAAPLPSDIFQPVEAQALYRVMAPLANRSLAIAIYNLHGDGDKDNPTFSTTITPDHYVAAHGMIQPYNNNWNVPKEGLLVYDWYNQTAHPLDSAFTVKIEGFGDRLLQLSPIEKGWSVIGRVDKYLAAAAVESITFQTNSLIVRLHESGPFGVWSNSGAPTAAGVEFIDKGNGFYLANLPVSPEPLEIHITRQ